MVLLGVQDIVFDPPLLEFLGEHLRGFNGNRTHQHRLPRGMARLELFDRGIEFFPLGLEDHVGQIVAH